MGVPDHERLGRVLSGYADHRPQDRLAGDGAVELAGEHVHHAWRRAGAPYVDSWGCEWEVPEEGEDFDDRAWIWSSQGFRDARYEQIHAFDVEFEAGLLVYRIAPDRLEAGLVFARNSADAGVPGQRRPGLALLSLSQPATAAANARSAGSPR